MKSRKKQKTGKLKAKTKLCMYESMLLISRLFEQKNKGISQIKLINIIKQLK